MINVSLADCLRQQTLARKQLIYWNNVIEEAKEIADKEGWDKVDETYKGKAETIYEEQERVSAEYKRRHF